MGEQMLLNPSDQERRPRGRSMINVEMIQKAIAAHAGWKSRLRSAIDAGEFDLTVAIVQADKQCEFGKWLSGPDFSAAEKRTRGFRNAMDLHAKFHQEAAMVVELATSGHKDQAYAAMGLQGSYSKASSALTKELVQWNLALS
jgi:Chemoreceptor zinc-binding domain